MLQNNTLLRGLFLVLVMGLYLVLNTDSSAWEPRLQALEPMNVHKNRDRVIRLGECRGCYLRGADFRNIDISGADLAGANLEGAIWTDGTVCQAHSIGRCIPPQPPAQE
ncbi:MAG: pentapeptide repeat-containing protein [bacterium]|nr:pentapeptide repeat-containing protein [bacterium]